MVRLSSSPTPQETPPFFPPPGVGYPDRKRLNAADRKAAKQVPGLSLPTLNAHKPLHSPHRVAIAAASSSMGAHAVSDPIRRPRRGLLPLSLPRRTKTARQELPSVR